MGGGGGGTFGKRSAQELRDLVRKADAKAGGAEFELQLSGLLGSLLSSFNDRDVEKVHERLEAIKAGLEGAIDGSFDRLFAGSVAKHTYVDGLSDIDSIIVINGTDLEGQNPRVTLEKMEQALKQHLPGVDVSHGRMAVTIQYDDGMKIQLLPAVKAEDGKLKVPSSRREAWSKIDPVQFQDALTRRNSECGQKLVPTIKLAKAINGQLPEARCPDSSSVLRSWSCSQYGTEQVNPYTSMSTWDRSIARRDRSPAI